MNIFDIFDMLDIFDIFDIFDLFEDIISSDIFDIFDQISNKPDYNSRPSLGGYTIMWRVPPISDVYKYLYHQIRLIDICMIYA